MVAGRALWLRVYRAAIFVGIVLMIHRGSPPVDPGMAMGVSLEDVREYFPSAAGIGERQEAHGGHFVLDAGRNQLGFVVATAPDNDDIIGYSGPNNVLLAFGADGKVLGISVLSSGDTAEHVAEVLADEKFMKSFGGKTWEEVRSMRRVDGVSGATLTSLAIAEGIIRRVAGSAPSLRFPEPLGLADAQRIFPASAEMGDGGEVFAADGTLLGRLLSSAPYSDNLVGYSGPSELLLGVVGASDEIVGIAIRDTYDTEKYVGYVTDEAGFMEMFNGKTLAEMAQFDLEKNEVEGVSGATMTSMTVARAVVALSQADAETVGRSNSLFGTDGWRYRLIGSGGIGTVLVILFGMVMAFTHLRGVRKLRIAFQLVLIGYLGLVCGDLLSQALLVGWAENGMAWRFAPGLLLLVAAALLVPLVAGKQVYCHHLCPHGAAQQLVKNWLPRKWRWKVPRRLALVLGAMPFCLLLFVVLVGVRQLAFNLVSIEPFDAYLFRVAGWATIVIAILGLVASLFVPMAYCRYACPTGAMLNFLWGGGVPGKFSRRDWLALGCLLLAIGLRISA